MPSTIEIKDQIRGSILYILETILDPPNVVHGDLFASDFSNPLDLLWLRQVMEDGGIDPCIQSSKISFYESIYAFNYSS